MPPLALLVEFPSYSEPPDDQLPDEAWLQSIASLYPTVPLEQVLRDILARQLSIEPTEQARNLRAYLAGAVKDVAQEIAEGKRPAVGSEWAADGDRENEPGQRWCKHDGGQPCPLRGPAALNDCQKCEYAPSWLRMAKAAETALEAQRLGNALPRPFHGAAPPNPQVDPEGPSGAI